MGDRKITLFELHFDGPLSLGPSFGSDDADEHEGTDTEESEGGDGQLLGSGDATEAGIETDGGVPVKGALVGLLAIAALAAAARVLLGGDDDEPADDDPEMVSIDEAVDDD